METNKQQQQQQQKSEKIISGNSKRGSVCSFIIWILCQSISEYCLFFLIKSELAFKNRTSKAKGSSTSFH